MNNKPSKTINEGRVNVPLGEGKKVLRRLAKSQGTTESNLARLLILDGLAKITAGQIVFRGPAIEPTGEEVAK